jgi:predicted NUDIX family NTP pyrophosphohydrolase
MPAHRTSAGLLLYRRRDAQIEVLLVHPGGPFWKKKNDGAWSISKGEPNEGEELLATALREVEEEIGVRPVGPFIELTPIKQKSGKTVHAWLCEGDCDVSKIKSNSFSMEWPPRSGKFQEFPEIDGAEWFSLEQARRKINPAQAAFLDAVASAFRVDHGI